MDTALLIQILLSTTGVLVVYSMNRVAKDIEKLTNSVLGLNEKVVVVLERLSHHEERLKQLELHNKQ